MAFTTTTVYTGPATTVTQRIYDLGGSVFLPTFLPSDTGGHTLEITAAGSAQVDLFSLNGTAVATDQGDSDGGTMRVNLSNDDPGVVIAGLVYDYLANNQGAAIGSVSETAPATDTATSGLNGRLQRIAQRLTSLITLVPTALSGLGNFKSSLADIAGTAPDTNSGSKSAGTLRVVLATDQPALTTAMPTNLTQVAGSSVLTGAGTGVGAQRVMLGNTQTITPARTVGTAYLAWADYTTGTVTAGTATDATGKKSVTLHIKMGRRSGSAFTSGWPRVRFETSNQASGNTDWISRYEYVAAIGASIANTTLSAQLTAAATSASLTAGTNVAVDDLLFVKGNTDAENEIFRVTSGTSSPTFNVAATYTHNNGNAVTDQAEQVSLSFGLDGVSRWRAVVDNANSGQTVAFEVQIATDDSDKFN